MEQEMQVRMGRCSKAAAVLRGSAPLFAPYAWFILRADLGSPPRGQPHLAANCRGKRQRGA
jgi:hypothetical protein